MDSSFSDEIPGLSKEHYEILKKSAISLDVIKERGYRSVSMKEDLEANGFSEKQRRPGLLIPNWGVDGKRTYCTLRPDTPRQTRSKHKDGSTKDNILKYEHPKDTKLRLDVPPRCAKNLKNPNIPLFIVEGVKKGDAIVAAGAECVVVISGVWGWRGTNEDGGKTVLADFDQIALNGRDIYIAMDSDLWSNINIGKAFKGLKGFLEYKKSHIHTLKFPDGEDGKKVGADDYLVAGHTLADIYALETPETPPGAKQVLRSKIEDFFTFDTTGFYFQKSDSHGVTEMPMGNFVAKIIEDITIDDGQTMERRYKIMGMMTENKKQLPIIEVPAESLQSLSWIDKLWGNGPFLYRGIARGLEEQFVTAMKRNSMNAERKVIYTHAGWREIGGKLEFLTSAGALGNPDILVELDKSLKDYSIPTPAPGTDMKQAVQTSLEFMNIGSSKDAQKFLMPIWAEMYLAPLCHVLKPTFTLWFYGESGSFKSTVSGLALSHFGTFDDITLPSNFHDTENRIEQLLYWAKDLPVVVDDWAPGQNIADAQRLEQKAERINRAQGNHQGRGRMKYGGIAQPVYEPRGLMVVTAEQLPRGHSNTARILSMKIKKGDIDIGKLTAAQKTKGSYRVATAGYLPWVRERWAKEAWNEAINPLRTKIEDYRNLAYNALQEDNQHPRIPQMVAYLYTGLEMGLTYATEIEAIPPKLTDLTLTEGWDYLIDLAREQNRRITKESACRRFLEVFMTLINAGVFRTLGKSDPNTPSAPPGMKFVGWEDEEFYYLLPATVYEQVCEFCNRTGEIFTVKDDAVWDQLKELNYIVTKPSEKGATTSEHITCYGHAVRVLKLKKSALLEPED